MAGGKLVELLVHLAPARRVLVRPVHEVEREDVLVTAERQQRGVVRIVLADEVHLGRQGRSEAPVRQLPLLAELEELGDDLCPTRRPGRPRR